MIGARLAEIRKDHGDTQEDLARKLYVAPCTVSAWERETNAPGLDMLRKICRFYNCSADWLLGLCNVDRIYMRQQIMKVRAMVDRAADEMRRED